MSTFWKTQIKALEYRAIAYSFNSHKLLRSPIPILSVYIITQRYTPFLKLKLWCMCYKYSNSE